MQRVVGGSERDCKRVRVSRRQSWVVRAEMKRGAMRSVQMVVVMAEKCGCGGEPGHGLPEWCQEPQVRFSGKYPCDARRMPTLGCGEIMVTLGRNWCDTWAGAEYGKAAATVGE